MPEFLTLLPPDEARALLFSNLPASHLQTEEVDVMHALGRVLAEDVVAPHPLPEFPRSTVDGYAVRATDTYGASESQPAYLNLIGEVPMGAVAQVEIQAEQCALIHTGGMLPTGADAVVMLEYTQQITTDRSGEIEVLRAVAVGENVITRGEDVTEGQFVMARGSLLRPADIGGLLALGITQVAVSQKVIVGLIATGDEIVHPSQGTLPGQVRDINTYTLATLVEKSGGWAKPYGIFKDDFVALQQATAQALTECDVVVVTAGSSASTRDMTADVIRSLGEPGVLVHGINTRPGKPTILGACQGKAIIGLPGNPVSAVVNGYLFVQPLIERLLGQLPTHKAQVRAKLSVNLSSQAGREDWWPVRLIPVEETDAISFIADPIFGKSNLIFTLAAADGLLRIAPDATGLAAGEPVDVFLF